MAMTQTEFSEFIKDRYGMVKNPLTNIDYKVFSFYPVGDGIKIPEGGRSILDLFEDMGYTTGAEIGVYEGQLSERMCKRFSGTIYSIDPWYQYDKYIYRGGIGTERTQEELDDTYKNVVKRLGCYANNTLIRASSVEGLSCVEKESLDFVYIDANHKHDFVWHDLRGWWPKIKHGGIMSGHDFCLVSKVLIAFVIEKKIPYQYCDSGFCSPILIPYDDGYMYWKDEDWFLYKE